MSLDSVFTSNAASDMAYGGQTSAQQSIDSNSSAQDSSITDHKLVSDREMDSPNKTCDDRFDQSDKWVVFIILY